MNTFPEMISYGQVDNKLMYPHCNPGMELVLVEQGHLEWAVNQLPEVLNPGSVFFTLPWQVHGSLLLREPPNRICYTLFSVGDAEMAARQELTFPESLHFSTAEQAALSDIFKNAPHHAWSASPLLKQLFPELCRRLDGASLLDAAAAPSLLRSILLELADIIGNSDRENRAADAASQKVTTLLRAVGEELDHPWTLDELAERCGLKRTQFAKLVKQLTGYAPLQYLSRIRFERACDLLRNSTRSITDIAFECGYSSSQYFAETFKQYARITPTEYRSYVPELDSIMQNNWDHPEWRTLDQERTRASKLHKREAPVRHSLGDDG